jgi:hypothetical protein
MGKKRIHKELRRISRRVSTLHGGGGNNDAKQDSKFPSYLYRVRTVRIRGKPKRSRRSYVG